MSGTYQVLRRAFMAAAPRLYRRLADRYSRPALLLSRIGEMVGWKVHSGPFFGTRYIRAAHGSRVAPKLIGSYERELHPWIERLLERRFRLVVNVGCGEGYYATGFARLLPHASVVAFDSAQEAREACAALADLNGVKGRVEVRGACDPDSLAGLDLAGALVVCDVEGYERTLLDPERVPGLRCATVLVELHDCFDPGVGDAVLARFRRSHAIEMVREQPRDPGGYAVLAPLDAEERLWALDEGRGTAHQEWALLTPLAAAPKTDAYAPLRVIMRDFGATCGPEEFYWAVNDAFHTAESGSYDDIHADMFEGLGAVWERMLQATAGYPRPMRVLDVGAGTGLVGGFLDRLAPGRIAGLALLDPCEAMLDRAEARARGWSFPVSRIRGDIRAVPGGARYDLVTVNSVLHHVVELEALCARLPDLLERGGFLMTAQDPRAEALGDDVYLERSRRARASRRPSLGARLRRKARALLRRSDPVARATSRALLGKGIIGRAMDACSIWAVTDFHVPGQPGGIGLGIRLEDLDRWLEGLVLRDVFAYEFHGVPWTQLTDGERQSERDWWKANDPHGRTFGSVWEKGC